MFVLEGLDYCETAPVGLYSDMLVDENEIKHSRSLTEKASPASHNLKLDRLSEREKVGNQTLMYPTVSMAMEHEHKKNVLSTYILLMVIIANCLIMVLILDIYKWRFSFCAARITRICFSDAVH